MRRLKTSYLVRKDGPTTIVGIEHAESEIDGILVINDTVEWRARYVSRFYDAAIAAGLIRIAESGRRRYEVSNDTKYYTVAKELPADIAALTEWARDAVSSVGAQIAHRGAKVVQADVIIAQCPTVGEIRYNGWKSVEKKSAHSFEALHDAMCRAAEVCTKAWGWVPTGLNIEFHDGSKAMGLAYNPGEGNRRISLNRRLFTSYDLDSIYRTTLHELCHHAREELHKRVRFRGFNSHDEKFCEMLGMVDEKVRGSAKMCQFFTDEQCLEVVEKSAIERGIVYSSSAGELRVGIDPTSRRLRMKWVPTGTARWRSTWELTHSGSLKTFLKLFPSTDRQLVRVVQDLEGKIPLPPAWFDRKQEFMLIPAWIDMMSKFAPTYATIKEVFSS